MLQFDFKKRVRYGETDQMGYLYYGNYAQYYEIGRVETMRHIGFPYIRMEEEFGVMMPVMNMQMRFLRPAKYDDLVTIRTILQDFPTERAWFKTELYNEKGKLLNAGDIRLAFVDMKTGKGCPPPQGLLDAVKMYF
jgi:acyl-CoA thioester hydrolase